MSGLKLTDVTMVPTEDDGIDDTPPEFYYVDWSKVKTLEDVISLLSDVHAGMSETDPRVKSCKHFLIIPEEGK